MNSNDLTTSTYHHPTANRLTVNLACTTVKMSLAQPIEDFELEHHGLTIYVNVTADREIEVSGQNIAVAFIVEDDTVHLSIMPNEPIADMDETAQATTMQVTVVGLMPFDSNLVDTRSGNPIADILGAIGLASIPTTDPTLGPDGVNSWQMTGNGIDGYLRHHHTGNGNDAPGASFGGPN